jgi:hypothetical protein
LILKDGEDINSRVDVQIKCFLIYKPLRWSPDVGVVSVYVYNTHTDMSEYFEGTRTDIRCRLNKRVSRALYVQEWIRFGLAEYSNGV